MPTFSCLNTFLTLFPILRAKYYHQSTTNISVLAVLQCQAAFVGWNLFVPYKTKIYNNSQSVATYSSSPSRYSTIYTICVTLKWRDLTSQWSTVSSLNLYPACWPQWAVSECAHMCVHMLFMCVSAAAVPVIAMLSWRYRGLYLCCLTQDKGCNCSQIHIHRHI